MESEQLQNFNERLSQWVANQGFWFQIRYSMAGSGTRGSAMFHLVRLGFRLFLFLLVVAAGSWIYLNKRIQSGSFLRNFRQDIRNNLSASDIEMRGFSRIQGQLGINGLACKGGDGTFFTSFEARNIRCKMGYLDGITSHWDPGTLSISKLDMELRAGADDPKSAQQLQDALFRQSKQVEINSIEIADANLNWGYSETNRGSIVNSNLKLQRMDDGWKLNFRGGEFTQNWLHKLEIVNLIVRVNHDGFVFEKAEFKSTGQGTVDLTGVRLVGGQRPVLSGMAKIRMLDLHDILPEALENYVEGTLSGDFKVSGSTNSPDGVGMESHVTLNGQDAIFIREHFRILQALSVVDYARNYHRVDLREGDFRIKTSGGAMEVTDIHLKGNDLLTLAGNVKVRPPTEEEKQAAQSHAGPAGGAPLFPGADEELRDLHAPGPNEMTLRAAAEAAKKAKEKKGDEPEERLFGNLGLGVDARRVEELETERLSRTLRYEGAVRITIPPDAFERAPLLSQQYPVDPTVNRIPIVVPLEGSIDEVTLKQAEDIYQQGKR